MWFPAAGEPPEAELGGPTENLDGRRGGPWPIMIPTTRPRRSSIGAARAAPSESNAPFMDTETQQGPEANCPRITGKSRPEYVA
jgi:hypothetical protein